MLQSPTKRRRTSRNTAVAVNESNDDAPTASNPTTPTRASYQSPTKASLARSHPHLISAAKARSLTEPRGRLLNNELLAGKKPGAAQSEKRMRGEGNTNNHRPAFSLASAEVEEPRADTSARSRSPLQTRQPSNATWVQDLFAARDEHPEVILPKLVKRNEETTRDLTRLRSNEPDLPPTPVQLGLDPAPDRPKGLSSSSPRGSKTGSGRHRRRVRDDGAVTSSPLKPRNRLQVVQDTDDQDCEAEAVQEAPESEAEPADMEQPGDIPAELKQKIATLRDLKAELAKVKGQTSTLEIALMKGDLPTSAAHTDDFLSLMKSASGMVSAGAFEEEHSRNNNGGGLLSYLHLFAPGNLQLSAKTLTRVIDGRPKVVHSLTVSAPPPWPEHVFTTVFEVVIDAKAVKIEKVKRMDNTAGRRQSSGIHSELQTWIQKRLKSELHCLDIGGLIWGMGRYFDECVSRAKVLKELHEMYNPTEDAEEQDATQKGRSQGPVTEDEAFNLLDYLTMSQLEIDLNEDESKRTRRGKKLATKMLLLWYIDLTWSGGVSVRRELIPSGIPTAAQRGAQEVFDRLVKAQGLVIALGMVWDLLKGEEQDYGTKETSMGRARFHKRKVLS